MFGGKFPTHTRSARLRQRLGGLAVLGLAGLQAAACSLFHDGAKRTVYTFDSSFAPADPQFLRSMDAFGTQMQGGNSVAILNNGDQFFPAMLDAIAAAKTTVDLESCIFKDDHAGQMFAEARR